MNMDEDRTAAIAPSIASGPLGDLKGTLAELTEAGASYIHFDIEDGKFVPVMNIGVKLISELRQYTELPFDVHLMMENPEWLIPDLAARGANRVSVHFEACPYPRRTLGMIVENGMQAGLAFNPATSLPDLSFCLPYLSFILLLTTDPEIKDPPFLPTVLKKIKAGKTQPALLNISWMVDGGINHHNVREVVEAGADVLVVGRGIYKNGKIQENMRQLKEIIVGKE